MKKIKVWQKIKAIDKCKMNSGEIALIIGKEYEVTEVWGSTFVIESEITKIHNFDFEYFDKYFQLSDFVSDVPELVGVEMEVSNDGKDWNKRIVLGSFKNRIIAQVPDDFAVFIWKHARPITKKVLTATLQELAEKLGVDEIQLK